MPKHCFVSVAQTDNGYQKAVGNSPGRHGPANDFAEEQFEHDRQIHPVRTGADISDIRCPCLIGVSTGIRPLHKNASTMAGV